MPIVYVNPEVAGSSRVLRKEMAKRLGPKALLVWSLLTKRRDANGYAHPTVPGLANSKEGERLSYRTVQRALDRLRASGLVVDVGFRFLEQLGKDGWPVEVYMRRVFGTWGPQGTVLVPISVWPKLMGLPVFRGHGGARAGSGPKTEKQAVRLTEFKWREGGTPTPLEPGCGSSSGVGVGCSSGVPIAGSNTCLGGDVFPTERHVRLAAEAVEGVKGRSVNPPPTEPLMVPADDPRVRGKSPELAKLWRQLLAPRPAPAVAVEDLMPVHPGPEEIHVTVPPPPRIPLHLEPDEQLIFCAKWYRAAVESRGLRCPPLAPLRSHRRYFEDFREVCLEKEIRPGAWVAWALDRVLLQLPTNARKRFSPPIKVLLSPKTLTEQRWMFREQEAEYCTPHMNKSRAGEAFMEKWRRVKLHLRDGARTKEHAERLLAEAWPEGYKLARARCRENTAAEGQEVRERIQLGEWIWAIPKRLRGARGSDEEGGRTEGAAVRVGRGI